MRIRSFTFGILLFSCVLCSGCFQIFYDIVQKSDGSFVIRQEIGFSHEFFDAMASFGSLADSSHSAFTTETLIDSMRHSFAHKRDSMVQIVHVIGKNGIKSLSVRDSIDDDSTVYFMTEAAISNVDSIPGAFDVIGTSSSNGMNPGSQTTDNNVRLKVTHPKGHTALTFYVPPSDSGFMQMDMAGLSDAFQNLSMHYRVFSSALERSKDKQIKPIPGGQERMFRSKELFKKGKAAHLEATFTIADR